MGGFVTKRLEEVVEVPEVVPEEEGTAGTVPNPRGTLELGLIDSCDDLHFISNKILHMKFLTHAESD